MKQPSFRPLDWQTLVYRLQLPAPLSTRLHFLRTGQYPLKTASLFTSPLVFSLNVTHTHTRREYHPLKGLTTHEETKTTCSHWAVPHTPMTEAALNAWLELDSLWASHGRDTTQDYIDFVFTRFWSLVSEHQLSSLASAPDTAPVLSAFVFTSEYLDLSEPTETPDPSTGHLVTEVDGVDEPAFDPGRPYGLQQSGASPCALDLDAQVTSFEGWNLAVTDAADRDAQTLLPPYLPNLQGVLEEGWGLAVIALQFDEREPGGQGWPQTVLTCHLPGCSHTLLDVGMSTAQTLFRHPKFNAEERKPMLHWVTREVLVVINSDHTFFPHLITLVPDAPSPDPAHLN